MAIINAVKDGNWSDPTVWDLNRQPAENDDVNIQSYHIHFDSSAGVFETGWHSIPGFNKWLASFTGTTGYLTIDVSEAGEHNILFAGGNIVGGTGEGALVRATGKWAHDLFYLAISAAVTGGTQAPALLVDTTAYDYVQNGDHSGNGMTYILNTCWGGDEETAPAIHAINKSSIQCAGYSIASVAPAVLLTDEASYYGTAEVIGGEASAAIIKDSIGQFKVWYNLISGSDNPSNNLQAGILFTANHSGDIILNQTLINDPYALATIKGGDGGYNSFGVVNLSDASCEVNGNLLAGEKAVAWAGKPPTDYCSNASGRFYVRPTTAGHKYVKAPDDFVLRKDVICGDTTGVRTDAVAHHVLHGHKYGNPNGQFEGTYHAPLAEDVLEEIIFGTDNTGTHKPIAHSHVRHGISNGLGQGLCYIPDAVDVRFGEAVDTSSVGSCYIPDPVNVRFGVAIDTSSTGLCYIPDASNVLYDVPVDHTVGLYIPTIDAIIVLDD